MTAYLLLENGTVFTGQFFGKPVTNGITGEVVFTTGMAGYIEAISDPSNYGKIVIQTFPLVGNYGVNADDLESNVFARAYVAKYPCQEPSNFRCEVSLDTFFMGKGITGVHGIDTRALTKIIRDHGTMNGRITANPPTQQDIDKVKGYKLENALDAAFGDFNLIQDHGGSVNAEFDVAILDLGVSNSTIRSLRARCSTVFAFHHNIPAEEILIPLPNGIVIAGGPGSPHENNTVLETIKKLNASGIPILAMGLGHQMLALANGHKVEKMKFGHRGANQPVKCTKTGRVFITQQNHGHHVLAPNPSYINVNDDTCEGIDYGSSFSVAFQPGVGPKDTDFIFDEFLERMRANATR